MPVSEFDLSGQIALVTGAGRSIGRGIARVLAEAGADVVLAGRTVPDLERVAAEIEQLGRRSVVVPCDVTREDEVETLFATGAAELGEADVVVANAGTFQEWGPSVELTSAEWQRVISVNLTGVMLTCRTAGASMVERRRGSIITIASIQGMTSIPRTLSYVASKFGVVGITKALAAEWANEGVRVNCIAPGFIERDVEPLKDDPEAVAGIVSRTPMGRFGQPREIGLAAVFLASSASSFVTGATLPVDGGWLTL